jgi:mannose/fructose/N-acetylgalactosamine-specific phosphotransferase system component IIC
VETPFLIGEYLALIALGGVLALDDRAGWQGLLSQPVFAALLVGVIVGAAQEALVVGLAMELVWLAILPMRGTKRPDAVAGAIVGAGTTCTLVQQTGDVRLGFLIGAGAFAGLVVGEAAGIVVRRLGKFRGDRIGRFHASAGESVRDITRRLDRYQAGALAYVFVLEAAMIALALPLSLLAVEIFTARFNEPFATGTRWWLDLLPALGAAAMIQHFWHRPFNRFLAVAAVIVMVILWIR